MTPVTIGDQRFIKDTDKGWIDSKTKQPADKGLIRLLDNLVIDEPVQKKLRIKLDRTVEPVSINGQKYVYDVNQGWLDEKTKVPAPPSLQTILTSSLSRFEHVGEGPSVFKPLGMTGEAALQKTKAKTSQKPKTGGGTLVKNRNTNINKPLVAMINQLASIDSYLKQQLENKQLIASKELAQAKEATIEAKDDNQPEEIKPPDAEKEAGLGEMAAAAGLAALIAYQFDPVKDAVKQIIDYGKSAGEVIMSVVHGMNAVFGDLAKTDPIKKTSNNSTASPIAPGAESAGILSADPAVRDEAFKQKASVPVAKPTSGAGILSADPKVRAEAFKQKTVTSQKPTIPNSPAIPNPIVPKAGAPTPGWSITAKPTATSAPPKAPAAAKPAQPVASPKTTEPVKLDKKFVDMWAKGLKNNATKANVQALPKGDIIALGKHLQTQGLRISGHSAFGGQEPGQHSANSRHYRDMAIDVNVGYDLEEANDPVAGAKFDALQSQLEVAGYNVIWRKSGHYNHMHISVGGPEGIGGGESPIATAVDMVTTVLETGKLLFGKTGEALIGTKNYKMQELTTAASKLGPMAKSYEMAKTDAIVDSRTPAPVPTVSKSVSPPNINSNKSSPVIQSPATESDMGGIDYYLERFGFKPAQSELARI